MNVRMVRQRLAPSVQNGEAANPRSEPAVIGGQRGPPASITVLNRIA